MDPLLFSPFSIRGLTLRNRIILSPMLTYSAHDGHINEKHLAHYGKFAAGGAGLVFVESTKIDPDGRSTSHDPGLWDDKFIEPLSRVCGLVKELGASVGIQLGHSGRKANRPLPWDQTGQGTATGAKRNDQWELIAPSAIGHSERSAVPREMTRDDISEIVAAFGKAASRAHRAGFDVLEIHGAHGYLIHQFLSPVANQRTDSYGGTRENRMRFAIETAARVRECWPQAKPLFFRISAEDDAGWDIEDSVALARALKGLGVDVIDCSSGGILTQASANNPVGYGYQVKYADAIRKGADITTMAVGLITRAEQAEEILASGKADLIALGRELLYNPNWPVHAAQALSVNNPYSMLPRNYEYWLEKRARGINP